MPITLTQIGTQIEQVAAGGNNDLNTVTSASFSASVDDLLVVCFQTIENSVDAWDANTFTVSTGTIGTVTKYTSSSQDVSGGYNGRASILVAKVTGTITTGTITASRTPTGNAGDHWTTAGFYRISGQDLTTPVPQAAVSNGSAGSASAALNLGSAPATGSMVIAAIAVNAGTTITPPGSFTEFERQEGAAWGGTVNNSYDIGSAPQNNTWTLGASSGWVGTVIEIAEAGGGAVPGTAGMAYTELNHRRF